MACDNLKTGTADLGDLGCWGGAKVAGKAKRKAAYRLQEGPSLRTYNLTTLSTFEQEGLLLMEVSQQSLRFDGMINILD